MTRGGKRPGAGRKPIGDPRDAQLYIRCKRANLEAWKEAAAVAGVSLTDWVETALDDAAARGRGR